MKRGVMYRSEAGHISGEVRVGMIIGVLKIVARGMAYAGAIMMLVATVGVMVIFLPVGWAEIRYDVSSWGIVKQVKRAERQTEKNGIIAVAAPIPATVITPTPKPEQPKWQVPDTSFSVYIPKIDAVSRVISDVDPNNSEQYNAALKLGVAAALGLSHPGQLGTTYLFAHSVGNRADYARYNAVFYLLDKLNEGDEVEIVYENKLYKYEVVNREILDPRDVRYLAPQESEEKLLLQTCYPPGTTWKRLVVTAKREQY
jgi:LPXTG-site transpeptidase (sortase) family protein